MNKSNKRGAGPKDITCAVRLDKALYQALNDVAELEHSSLSDVIRSALVDKIDAIRKKHIDRLIEDERLQVQLENLRSGGMDASRAERLEALEKLRQPRSA